MVRYYIVMLQDLLYITSMSNTGFLQGPVQTDTNNLAQVRILSPMKWISITGGD